MQEHITRKTLDMISAANTLTLPMDVRRIAGHFRYRVHYYSRSQPMLESFNLSALAARRPAITTKRWGKYYIFLSDALSRDEERYALAHELGHIALGHLEPDAEELSKEEADEQADMYALLLLASPPILEQYGIDTPENIRVCTGLSLNDSRQAYKALQQYRLEQQEAARREDIARRARSAIKAHKRHGPLWPLSRSRFPANSA